MNLMMLRHWEMTEEKVNVKLQEKNDGAVAVKAVAILVQDFVDDGLIEAPG